MKKSKYREEKTVLYRAEFGLADRTPSRFEIFRYASETEECHGVLDETDVVTSYNFESFSRALAHLSTLIYFGRHKGHGKYSHEYSQSEPEPKRGVLTRSSPTV